MIGRDLKDHEIVTALVAGQISAAAISVMRKYDSSEKVRMSIGDVDGAVTSAEAIVAEVVRRTEERGES